MNGSEVIRAMHMFRRSTTILLTALVPSAITRPSTAQCLEWSPVFAPTNAPNSFVLAMLVHDEGDGLGPALYVAGRLEGAGSVQSGKVVRFRHGVWSAVHPGSVNDDVYCLASFDSGAGSNLYMGGYFSQFGATPLEGVARWSGTTWEPLTPPFVMGTNGIVLAMRSFDDGTGNALYIGGYFDNPTFTVEPKYFVKWDGSAYTLIEAGMDGSVRALEPWDDGSGPALYVGGAFRHVAGSLVNGVARWTGTAWQSVGAGFINDYPNDFEVFDDGSGPALYAALGLAPGVVRWDGASWSTVGGGTNGGVNVLQVFDDGDGLALYAAGGLTSAGGMPASGIAKWDGVQWRALGSGVTSLPGNSIDVNALAVWDDGYGGGSDLMLGGYFRFAGDLNSRWFAAWRGCSAEATSFCSGDGTLRECPCTNNGAPGFGCGWSGNAQGTWLVHSGTTSPETIVLTAHSMPNTGTSLFLKADQVDMSGIPFGDGVRCIDGALVRLGTRQNSGGSAQYPDTGDPLLSVRGGTPPGSGLIAYYQTYFRNAAAYCTSATFNITNGVRVVW